MACPKWELRKTSESSLTQRKRVSERSLTHQKKRTVDSAPPKAVEDNRSERGNPVGTRICDRMGASVPTNVLRVKMV